MVGYDLPCRYCEALVPPDSAFCPVCGKVNPTGPLRCPKCRSPIRKAWARCSHCGLPLKINCPHCGKETFFGDYCEHCSGRLVVTCLNPRCGFEQPPVGDVCVKCGRPLR